MAPNDSLLGSVPCPSQVCLLPSLMSVGSHTSQSPRLSFCLGTPGSPSGHSVEDTLGVRLPAPHGPTCQGTHGHMSIWHHIESLTVTPTRHSEAYQASGSWSAAGHTGPLVSPQVLEWRPTLLAATWYSYWKYPRTSGRSLGPVGTLPPSCFHDPRGL